MSLIAGDVAVANSVLELVRQSGKQLSCTVDRFGAHRRKATAIVLLAADLVKEYQLASFVEDLKKTNIRDCGEESV
jgi:hypothetical protein